MIGWTAACGGLLAACALVGHPAAADAGDVPAPLVVVGVGSLAWEDVSPDRTPQLWQMLADGADAAAVSVRQVPGVSCPADGWLSLSAGQRATGPRSEPTAATPPRGSRCGELPDVGEWAELRALQDRSDYDPELGLLAETLAAHDVCATAVGPGAALMLADSAGVVERYQPDLQAGTSFACPVTVVDAGTVLDPDRDLAIVDRRVGEVLDRAPPEATVLVVSVSDIPGAPLELGVALLATPRATDDPRLLRTATTRWDGVIRLLDVSSTVTAAVDVPDPGGFYGAPLTRGADRPGDTVGRLLDITRTDQVLRKWSSEFTHWPGAVQLALYAVALVWAWPHRWAGRAFTAAALVFAWLPVAAFLVTLTGWWRSESLGRALWAGMAVIAVLLAAATAPVRRQKLWWTAGLVSLVTFVVVTVDGVTGSTLHRGSLLGPSPALGGRFYGFGNPTFSVYVVATFVLAGAVAAELSARGRRRQAAVAVVGIGALAMLVDVWPTWGGDVGGGLAMVPGVVLLALVVADLRVTLPRLAAAAAAGVAIVAAVGIVDWLRPERQRSHAGRFVQELLDGEAWSIVSRKAGYAWDSLDAGPPAGITLAVVALSAAALLRPARWAPPRLRAAFEQWPTLHATLAAVLLTVVIGAVVNDYGVRIATIALPAVLPLVAVTCALEGKGVVPDER